MVKNEKNHVGCITINTDASFHPYYKVGGYAFYIVCDLFKIQKGGMFKNKAKNSQDCEAMAIANAIHTLIAQKELPSTTYIVINSDCISAYQAVGLKRKGIYKITAEALRSLRKRTIGKKGVPKFQFRHVKAHNGTPDARSYVNDWCDNEAKRWMRKAVEKLKTEPKQYINDTQV